MRVDLRRKYTVVFVQAFVHLKSQRTCATSAMRRVWAQVDRVVGKDVSEQMRLMCEEPDRGVPPEYL